VRARLAHWARVALGPQRDEVRRLDAETLHITLCFLGHRPVEEIDPLATIVLDSAADADGSGAVDVGAPLWLPPRRPRVLAIELHDETGALGDLHGRVVTGVAATIEWEAEKRRFRPHLTVARMRAGTRIASRELPPTPALSFVPESLTLYRSRLARSGAVYEPVARGELWA
jgi:RNA 2',3'-cyclic 3'-phosphodiesterase